MQIKGGGGVTMATSHGSPLLVPVTLKFSVESKYTYLKTEDPPWTKRWVGGENQKAKRQAKAEQNHEGESAQYWHNYACPQRTSAGQEQISQLTLIIDNLIYHKENQIMEKLLIECSKAKNKEIILANQKLKDKDITI